MKEIPTNPTAAYMLETYQEQLDADGISVGVSRQALDEVLEQLKTQKILLMDIFSDITKDNKVSPDTFDRLVEVVKNEL